MFDIKLYDGRVEILMPNPEADHSTIVRANGRICRYWGSALALKDGDALSFQVLGTPSACFWLAQFAYPNQASSSVGPPGITLVMAPA